MSQADFKALEAALGQPCPVELKIFHATGGSLLRYAIDGVDWSFPSPAKLLEPVKVGKNTLPYIRQLKGFASIIAQRTSRESVFVEGGQEMSLSRLECGWAIADADGNQLFLDPISDFSLWVFRHDGPTVERVAPSLCEWICTAEKKVPAKLAPDISSEVLKLCIEDALRDYLRHVMIPRGFIKADEFFVSVAGHTVINRKEGAVVEKLADIIVKLHNLDPSHDRELREKLFNEISRLGNS